MVKSPFWYLFKPNLYGQIRAAEGCMRVGEKCVKYLKRGWNRREGREKKNFKKEVGNLGQGVSALKREGLEPPYELCITGCVQILQWFQKFICQRMFGWSLKEIFSQFGLQVRNGQLISFLILRKLEWIDWLLFPLKSSKTIGFLNFKENRN